ncbi:MAG: CaiB/BaiF CoA transferase family protein [Reyranellaceae bacterium]
MDRASEPLSDIRVLDLTRILAGPWCTQMLADFGADVLKVEQRGAGDESRAWGPPFYRDKTGERVSSYFCCANRGKRSIAIDFNSPADRAEVLELARQADVLVENFRVGGLKKWGLDYESVRKINPGIVFCSITGYGQTGPHASRAGYDSIMQAVGGMMSVTGEADDKPGGGPQKSGVPVIDLMTGVYAVAGIMIALHHRRRTGEGQWIDISLLDTQVTSLSTMAAAYYHSGHVPKRTGNEHPTVVPGGVMPCSDGHVMLMVGSDRQFARMCQRLGLPHLAEDGRFRGNEQRVAHKDALMPMLKEAFAKQPRAHWIEVLSADGVPCGPINDIGEVLNDQQVVARELVARMSETEFGDIAVMGNPLHLSRTPPRYRAPPMMPGGAASRRFRERQK